MLNNIHRRIRMAEENKIINPNKIYDNKNRGDY